MGHPCACCRRSIVDYGDICPVCDWEDDFLLDEESKRTDPPTGWSDANGMTLARAQAIWRNKCRR